MPPLGTSEMDTVAVDLIRRWIVEDLPQRQGYDQWAARWLPQPWESLRSQSLDPDADGLDNFTEYLLREGPLNPQRRFIKTAAVARAVCWLASPEASDINGHALALSGGEV